MRQKPRGLNTSRSFINWTRPLPPVPQSPPIYCFALGFLPHRKDTSPDSLFGKLNANDSTLDSFPRIRQIHAVRSKKPIPYHLEPGRKLQYFYLLVIPYNHERREPPFASHHRRYMVK